MRLRSLTLVSFAVILSITAGAAFGQFGQTILASIPFPFVIQGKQLPAGKYSFSRDVGNPAVLEIRSQDGTQSMLVLTESAETMKTPDQTDLVFDKIDGKYFLAKLRSSGNVLGWQIPEVKAEQRWEKDYVASHTNAKPSSQNVTMHPSR